MNIEIIWNPTDINAVVKEAQKLEKKLRLYYNNIYIVIDASERKQKEKKVTKKKKKKEPNTLCKIKKRFQDLTNSYHNRDSSYEANSAK